MKRYLLAAIGTLLLFSICFTGCKKESTGASSLVGKYVVVSGGYASLKYIQLTEDTIYLMHSIGNYGTRDVEAAPTRITDDSIGYYNTSWSYSFSHDELSIHNFYGDTLLLLRNENVPAWNEWVQPVSFTSLGEVLLPNSAQIRDLATYGNEIITSPFQIGSNFVFKKLAITAGSFSMTEIPVDPANISKIGYLSNIDYMNSSLLMYQDNNQGGALHVVSPYDGLLQSSTPVQYPPGAMYSMANDGVNLWGMTAAGIRKFDFVNNAWGNEITTGGTGAMAGRNGLLYLAIQHSNTIQVFNPTTYRTEAAYSLPSDYRIFGLTFLGTDIIASVYDYKSSKYVLMRIAL